MAQVTVHQLPLGEIGPLVADRLCAAVKQSPKAFLCMATGSTPIQTGFWENLKERAGAGTVDFSQNKFVNPDEWLRLPTDHSEAYRSYLRRHLTDHVKTTLLVPDGNAADPVQEAIQLERDIIDGGGFTWTMLGMGINGHIGFFEPNAEGLSSQAFTPAIDEINRQRYAKDHFGGDLEQVPTHAVTIGLGTVMRSKELCLVVVGPTKARLLAQALHGPVTPALPASLLQLASCLHVFWYPAFSFNSSLDASDEAASSDLDLAALAARPGWSVHTATQ